MRNSTSKPVIFGQPSWRLASKSVEAYVTETGGQLGPVTFKVGDRKIQPFSIAPWHNEEMESKQPQIIRVLRGDFFCLPFGGNGKPFRGERHPVHGETANDRWRFEEVADNAGVHSLHLSLRTGIRRGRVDKQIELRDGHSAVYCRHVLSGFRGPLNPGHHAMLRFPDAPGSGVISTSRFIYGQVFPGVFEAPEHRGYTSLVQGSEFKSLEAVPLQTGGTADLTRYPARRGFEDLVMIVSDDTLPFAWTAVTFPRERYVWFALKDPRVLRETVLWISNGGRHYPPWNSRHVNVMGLEDVTAYFHYGLAESASKNPLSAKGIPTSFQLRPNQSSTVNYIMGVAAIPSGFDRVAEIESAGDEIVLRATSGKTVRAVVDLGFLGL